MERERVREMEYMKLCMRKLALWFTRTFKPIMTHEELEPIMATLGFVGLPPSTPNAAIPWKEYLYMAGGSWRSNSSSGLSPAEAPPKPRLPYPRIDGLHIYTYRAFLDAVNFYIDLSDISDLFHIRGMPFHSVHDHNRKWRRMEEDESVFVYREGTLDQGTYNVYHFDKSSSSSDNDGRNGCNSIVIRNKGNNTQVSCIVSLKDIIV
ncbi:hypothetical protein I3843_05G086100 [Carya illinoinensis]|uniref:Uncharacterized protein n=1 Tax=Carya illinoinensis TaxID=32201 RepID=A0A922JKU8_CARIL|nr:uncharacterized protein LOC122309732 isoform X1 [Carya illinoinensis]KAG2706269.1 hypothetical protein I3760_05G096300 [Carya illinoinensis]KAG6712206.1 hypothetical protein I3842_05G092600 [Carya illinoinensis]KAG7978508.1 hypothetical protein I3843_05G086100 [Carya illinoinensis]